MSIKQGLTKSKPFREKLDTGSYNKKQSSEKVLKTQLQSCMGNKQGLTNSHAFLEKLDTGSYSEQQSK